MAYESPTSGLVLVTYKCRVLECKWNVSLYKYKWNPNPLILHLLVANLWLIQGEENK